MTRELSRRALLTTPDGRVAVIVLPLTFGETPLMAMLPVRLGSDASACGVRPAGTVEVEVDDVFVFMARRCKMSTVCRVLDTAALGESSRTKGQILCVVKVELDSLSLVAGGAL